MNKTLLYKFSEQFSKYKEEKKAIRNFAMEKFGLVFCNSIESIDWNINDWYIAENDSVMMMKFSKENGRIISEEMTFEAFSKNDFEAYYNFHKEKLTSLTTIYSPKVQYTPKMNYKLEANNNGKTN